MSQPDIPEVSEDETPVQTDNRPTEQDGDQDGISQDPAVDYTVGSL